MRRTQSARSRAESGAGDVDAGVAGTGLGGSGPGGADPAVGEEQLAGIMDAGAWLPEGSPAAWSVYFDIANADATLDQIVDLGGSVVAKAEDTPYGRMAAGLDPTGALFKLRTPPAA